MCSVSVISTQADLETDLFSTVFLTYGTYGGITIRKKWDLWRPENLTMVGFKVLLGGPNAR